MGVAAGLSLIRRNGRQSRSRLVQKRRAKERAVKGHVSWVNELAVKEGKLETFRELMEEMVSGTSGEPGTLAYQWYISHDGGTVHVFEIYADSEAVVAHHVSKGFMMQNWARRVMECFDSSPCALYRRPHAAAPRILPRPAAPHPPA